MNLLKDKWIPVRPLPAGVPEKIGLKRLLCGEEKWEISLPRDDMELAALQLLVCLAQALLMPKDTQELRQLIARPISEDRYETASADFDDWFRLDHPDYPFMQVKGVSAKETTAMAKLLAGVTGATNSCFVNEPGLGAELCGGCAAIALFNQSACAPSFGGGFKAGLRGMAPITTLVQGRHLRETIFLNMLCEEVLLRFQPWHKETKRQQPTWIDPIKQGSIRVQQIGFLRGLFWQPAHIELNPPGERGNCSCCGFDEEKCYHAFNKAKFNYTVEGTWPHPHSPRISLDKKGVMEEKFAAFTTSSPSWTQLSRFIVKREASDAKNPGQQPAAVIQQVREVYGDKSEKLHLLAGGYRNNQASVLERRHEVFTLNHGWDSNTEVIQQLVSLGLGYRDALYKGLFVFVNGIRESKGNDGKKIKGAGVKMHQLAEAQFYRRTEPVIQDTLARIDFSNAAPFLTDMQLTLKHTARDIFDESVRPYLNDPELIHTLAVARRTLNKHLRNLEPQENEGGKDGTERE